MDYRKASSRGAYGHDPFLSVFWRASTWFHNNRYYNGTIYIRDNVIVPSDLVESSGYSSKTLQKGSCPYAPLDEVLQYGIRGFILKHHGWKQVWDGPIVLTSQSSPRRGSWGSGISAPVSSPWTGTPSHASSESPHSGWEKKIYTKWT